MQFKYLALLGVSASTAVAQVLPTDPSILAVLATGIPSSVQALARESPAALVSQLQSSLSAGSTPEWYAALPTNVRSILPSLFPAATSAVTTPATTEAPVPTSAGTGTGTISNIRNSTTVSTVRSPTLSASSSIDGEASATSSSTGGASYPTAVFGAGVAGALGVLGMLAL